MLAGYRNTGDHISALVNARGLSQSAAARSRVERKSIATERIGISHFPLIARVKAEC
jgi:hypothetical protein